MKPFEVTFGAPNRVASYLFADGSWVVENFNDRPVTVKLNGQTMEIAARQWRYAWK